MRNILLSFLGTSNYIECIYEFNSKKSSLVKYIQESIVEMDCLDWTTNDKIIIFVTKLSVKKNLEELLQKIKRREIIEIVNIPDGLNESEIWEIFRIVFDKLNENDKVIYDITHSFRSLPMLGITLLHYAKFLKKIEINKIYYGAFEVLGSSFEIETKYPNPSDRIAPILDLTSFSILQDWTDASSEFVKYGFTNTLKILAENEYLPILKEKKGNDLNATNLKNIVKNITIISDFIQTSNGKEIINSKIFDETKVLITNYSNESLVPAFKPLLDKISDSIKDYHSDNIMNGFEAVKWCVKNNLIQQGYTLLQEILITFIAQKINKNYLDKKIRADISSSLNIINSKITEDKWKLNDNNIPNIIIALKLNSSFYKLYDKIGQIRNTMNHAHFNSNKIGDMDLKKKLENIYQQVYEMMFKETNAN